MEIIIKYGGDVLEFDCNCPKDIANLISYVAEMATIRGAASEFLDDLRVRYTFDGAAMHEIEVTV